VLVRQWQEVQEVLRRGELRLAYWQATDRDEASEADPEWFGRGSESQQTRQKALFPPISFRYPLFIGRLKILGHESGVWVQDPPSASIS